MSITVSNHARSGLRPAIDSGSRMFSSAVSVGSRLNCWKTKPTLSRRSVVSRPEVIFADEPTGNLDSRSGAEVLNFLRNSVREFGQTIVMVTHDPNAASYADRVVFLADGQVVDELAEPTADAVLDTMKRLDGRTPADRMAWAVA